MYKISLIIFLIVGMQSLRAQLYQDYIGAGHVEGISISSSSNMNQTNQLINKKRPGKYGSISILNISSYMGRILL